MQPLEGMRGGWSSVTVVKDLIEEMRPRSWMKDK